MDAYDNPAGRLYALLSALRKASRGTRLSGAWASVLQVDETSVVLALGQVVQLVPGVEKAVREVGDEAYLSIVARHRSSWEKAIIPRGAAMSQAINDIGVMPTDESMEALAVVASHLHREASEGLVPSEDEVADLDRRISELIVEIQASDLPGELKHLVLSRLHDILEALRHLAVQGPAAVRHAVEALVGSVEMTQHAAAESAAGTPTWKKLVRSSWPRTPCLPPGPRSMRPSKRGRASNSGCSGRLAKRRRHRRPPRPSVDPVHAARLTALSRPAPVTMWRRAGVSPPHGDLERRTPARGGRSWKLGGWDSNPQRLG